MKKSVNNKKPWGGRFSEDTEKLFEAFSSSVDFDRRLYAQDIEVSIAHIAGLTKAGILSDQEKETITSALHQIKIDIESGDFEWDVALEDVHMNIESRLVELVGDVGKKLHTGRSRNDLVATDLRLYCRHQTDILQVAIMELQKTLVSLAERESTTLMPAFTHLQAAQPISFGHHMLAWFEMLKRDQSRLSDLRKRINVLPLGSAACAGTSYPIDREYVAQLLGFETLSANSLDAVSDRDFALELSFACALIMMHFSRMCEEMILWCSQPFNFIDLPDRFCTGSSIMPQKKNPDSAELIRGKSARVYGAVVSLLTLMKAQVLAYNRDNQEDKEILFDALDTTLACTQIMNGVVGAIKVNTERMGEVLHKGFTTATDLADYLVKKSVAFRDAHRIVGQIVQLAIESNRTLDQLDIRELQAIAPQIDEEACAVLNPDHSLRNKNIYGGTAPQQVAKQIKLAHSYIADFNK